MWVMVLGEAIGGKNLLNEAPEQGQTGILICPGSSVIDVKIAVAAVYIQYGTMPEGRGSGFGSVDWQPAIPQLPVNESLPEYIDAVRVWRFSKEGEEPQVVIRAR